MEPSIDVLVVGDYCYDFIFTGLNSLPVLGNEIESTGFEATPGGTYITAISLHRLGVRTAWGVDFGTDEFSRKVEARLEEEGFDARYSVHHPTPLRKVTVSMSFPQDRAFVAFYDKGPRIIAGFHAIAKASARICFIPGLFYGPAFDAGHLLIRKNGMKIVMDGNSQSGASLKDRSIRRALSKVDIFLPNAREARMLTGCDDLMEALVKLGEITKLVVLKDGGNGSYAIYNNKIVYEPAIKVTPIDTTGAGDSFNAGFLAAWLEDRSLNECLRWGNVVGGLSTTMLGGATRKTTRADLFAYLSSMTKE